jgi:hypothetical protein
VVVVAVVVIVLVVVVVAAVVVLVVIVDGVVAGVTQIAKVTEIGSAWHPALHASSGGIVGIGGDVGRRREVAREGRVQRCQIRCWEEVQTSRRRVERG